MSTVRETMISIQKKIELLQSNHQELLNVVNKEGEKEENCTNCEPKQAMEQAMEWRRVGQWDGGIKDTNNFKMLNYYCQVLNVWGVLILGHCFFFISPKKNHRMFQKLTAIFFQWNKQYMRPL